MILLSAAFVSGLTACQDFLVKEPKLDQSNELTLATYDGLNSATAGLYSYLSEIGWYGQVFTLGTDMRSGNGVRDNVRNSGRLTQEYDWNYIPTNSTGIWSYAYVTIAAANNVIDNLAGKEGSDVTEQDLNNLKAECLFIRALSHFDCVITYAQPYTYKPESLGVPVVLHTDSEGKPARETVAKVYEQIVADLTEAETIIDPAYSRSDVTDPKAVASLDAIRALLSRVYLYMGNWQKAADYATLVIDSENYQMWTATQYPDVWGKSIAGEGGEVIFEIYNSIGNDTHGHWDDITWMTSPDGYGDPMVSNDLLALYDENDIRYTAGFRTTDEKNEAGRMWTAKYPGKGEATPDANNIIVLRLSEMYLNRAEALYNGATIEGVTKESDINTIRSNRGVASIGSVTIQNIKNERRMELAWEGHHVFDLARWGDGLTRTDFTLGTKNQNIPFPDYRWALPIPQRELDLNENLVQNEGYN